MTEIKKKNCQHLYQLFLKIWRKKKNKDYAVKSHKKCFREEENGLQTRLFSLQ